MMPSCEELFDSSLAFEHENLTLNALADIPTCKGVLLFADSNHRPIQLLQAANLRRTARSKLFRQDESISKKTDISELTKKLFWRCGYNDFITQTTYVRLAQVLFGKQSDNWVHLSRPCFSVIETDSNLPYFDISGNPTVSEKRAVYGLFPNRKSATAFCKILNSVFGLCQNPALLKTANPSSCPYLQMKKCLGPCLDSAQKESYLSRVHKLADNAIHTESALNVQNKLMHDAANRMDFEKANELKKRIDLLTKLRHPNYRWVHHLKDLSILHVDRTFKKSIEGQRKQIQQYQWFKIDAEAIYDLGSFSPASRQDIDGFLERNWTDGTRIPFTGNTGKHLANLAFFLYRSKNSGLWLDCSDGIMGNQLYIEMERFLGVELPAHGATNKDTE